MRRLAALAALLVIGCSPRPDLRVPGATRTPALGLRLAKLHPQTIACGDDIAIDGDHATDVRYGYDYDALGRLVHATGVYTAGGSDDAIDYSYDNLDHMTHMVESHGWGGSHVEITASYDTLGDLIDYTNETSSPGYHDKQHYTYAGFTDAGQPTIETAAGAGQEIRYDLAYDATGRLAVAAEGVPGTAGYQATVYTYDDDARTTTIDTNHGAFHGVIELDDQNRELSEVWGGSDPAAYVTDETFAYDEDRLLAITYRSGTADAPQQPTTVEVDTIRYDCSR